MTKQHRRSVGDRIVGLCLGALVCAAALTIAVDLLRAISAWLVGIGLIVLAAATYVWWLRRW